MKPQAVDIEKVALDDLDACREFGLGRVADKRPDVRALGGKMLDDLRTDVAGGACYENGHGSVSWFVCFLDTPKLDDPREIQLIGNQDVPSHSWNDVALFALTDFNLVARHGGFGKTARATGRPKATFSRRVAELEGVLDLRLFERGDRDLKFTEEGRALHERTAMLLTEIDETVAGITSC